MSRDADRSTVYAAEELVFAETLFAEPLGAAGILDLADRLAEHPWWRTIGVPFAVAPARRESQHSSASGGTGTATVGRIRLSLHQEDASTLAHEAAHLLATAHGATVAHGALFRAAECDVVSVLCGSIAATRLATAFIDAGLVGIERSWEAPQWPSERGLYGRWRTEQLTNEPL